MSRDLLGEFGDFSSAASTTSNNTFSAFSAPAPAAPQTSQPKSQALDDLFGLFDAKPAGNSQNTISSNSTAQPANYGSNQFSQFNQFGGKFNSQPAQSQYQHQSNLSSSTSLQPPRPPLQAASSEAIISGLGSSSQFSSKPSTPQPASTTLFSASPQQNPVVDDDFDDFGDFAEEPLPSSNPTFGPFSNVSSSSPTSTLSLNQPRPAPSSSLFELQQPEPQKPQLTVSSPDDDFGQFIYTPRVPTPPPQQPSFSLSSTLTNPNHSHPSHPPPPLHRLLPLLTTQLLSPLPFLTRLKPLSYPAKQRLLSSSTADPRIKASFTGIILTAHVTGRLIASKRIRPRRNYPKPRSSSPSLASTSKSDTLKDDREISECVREYSDILGSLRAVVRGMGLVVPEFSVDMPVQTTPSSSASSKPSSGGKSNSAAGRRSNSNTPPVSTAKDEFCWLCGLGPLDRITKLKEDGVGDGVTASVGDGKDIDGKKRWVAGWGHRSCRNWWEGCGSKEIKI
ncbi:hypothetical protein H072_6610 [Dactylellina haptotyla CBS 200.50]|uniref:Uncharacterized protein n=1 Tax=Dactylellina haptotyla (strain CBS 200.50) TaxID=1284197 RepID=S8BW67_DACHA|nr:hypothetical protein H072_6610 [Dactylellina haptotyla CBS 200.50]